MARSDALLPAALALALVLPVSTVAATDLHLLAACQKKIAGQGARFAQRVIKANLKCAEETVDCQVQCEEGVFGQPCDDQHTTNCCDPDDPNSNTAFKSCMDGAQAVCDQQNANVASFESQKKAAIIATCSKLTDEELCGSQTEGLNFLTLNAGCAALDPNYTCTLTNLVNCVGGPLEQQLLGQISAVLNPRLPDGIAAIKRQISGVPVARRVKQAVAAGKADLYQISGQAGDQIVARAKTADDTGTDQSTLHATLALLDSSFNVVPDTNVVTSGCPVANACGSGCPVFKRTLPDDGTFYVAVIGLADGACTGGKYRLTVISPNGSVPVLGNRDDVTPP